MSCSKKQNNPIRKQKIKPNLLAQKQRECVSMMSTSTFHIVSYPEQVVVPNN